MKILVRMGLLALAGALAACVAPVDDRRGYGGIYDYGRRDVVSDTRGGWLSGPRVVDRDRRDYGVRERRRSRSPDRHLDRRSARPDHDRRDRERELERRQRQSIVDQHVREYDRRERALNADRARIAQERRTYEQALRATRSETLRARRQAELQALRGARPGGTPLRGRGESRVERTTRELQEQGRPAFGGRGAGVHRRGGVPGYGGYSPRGRTESER